jgi:hypothetical protein
MIATQSASERKVCTCGSLKPGSGSRTGSAPVAIRAQRNPFLRRVASQIVFREVWPVDGRRRFVAQHRNAALIAFAPQHFRSRKACSPAAHDHDPVWSFPGGRAARLAPWRRPFLFHENFSIALLDGPARYRAEGGSAYGFASAQIECGVVPGAADRVPSHKAVSERSMVMRAMRADGENLVPAAHEQDRLAAAMAGKDRVFGKLGERNPLCEIGAAWRLFLRHRFSPFFDYLFYCR